MGIAAGVAWTEEDAARVAAGEITLAELGAAKGVSRQAASAAYRKRGWPTHPVAAPVPSPHPTTAAATHETAPAPAPGRAPIPCILDSQAGEVASAVAGNALFHAIANAERMLVSGQVGPSGIKQLVGSIGDALDGLDRLGLLRDERDGGDVATMKIVEMTADRVEEIRSRVEADFGREFAEADDDDPLPGHLGTSSGDDRPPAGTEQGPAPRGLPEALQTQSFDVRPADVRSVDLEHLAGRLEHLADRHGRIRLRQLAVELGVQTAQATGEMIAYLVVAVRRDPTLSTRLDAELDRAGL